MKYSLKAEELITFLACVAYLALNGVAWWVYPILLLGPDIGMVGYLINPKIGAYAYNLFHHKGIAVAVGTAGYFLGSEVILMAGVVLLGHSCMDRIFGFGLKFEDDFKNTHLGRIG